jgi:hypothetical protein
VKAPTCVEVTPLTRTIAQHVGRCLQRQRLLERDAENSYLSAEATEAGLSDQLFAHSITHRIAMSPHAGRKAPLSLRR